MIRVDLSLYEKPDAITSAGKKKNGVEQSV